VLASPALLGGSALVALQLLARGYSVDQIAGLRRADAVGVLWDLQRALTAMGVTSVRDAVVEARALGLLV
jgi:hypothetical protein